MPINRQVVVIVIVLILSSGIVVPGTVSAQENPPEDEVFNVSDDGVVKSWERALYPLRIDDTEADVQIPAPQVNGEEVTSITKGKDDQGQNRSLIAEDTRTNNERNPIGVQHNNLDKPINITFDGFARASNGLASEEVQLVSARLTPEEGKRLPATTDDFLDLFSDIDNANANATFRILNSSRSISNSGFTEQVSRDEYSPGQHIIFAAINRSGDGIEIEDNQARGNITIDGEIIIVGADQLYMHHADNNYIEEPSDPSIGENVTFDITAT